MTDAFLDALIDAIVPGGPLGGSIVAPAGAACAERQALRSGIAPLGVAKLIATSAGGESEFIADSGRRAAALDQAQLLDREGFAKLIDIVLRSYYQAPDVLEAFHWRSSPPQPQGHALPPFDESLLLPVRRRGPLWRRAASVEVAHVGEEQPSGETAQRREVSRCRRGPTDGE